MKIKVGIFRLGLVFVLIIGAPFLIWRYPGQGGLSLPAVPTAQDGNSPVLPAIQTDTKLLGGIWWPNRKSQFRAVAKEWQRLLIEVDYERICRTVFGTHHGNVTLFELARRDSDLRTLFQNTSTLENPRDRLAARMFLFGDLLTVAEVRLLFGEHVGLLTALHRLGLVVQERPGESRLNDYMVHAFSIHGRRMHILCDIPRELALTDVEPAAQIAGSSHVLLRILCEGAPFPKHVGQPVGLTWKGVIADFGSGTGIQSITLLALNPHIETAIGVEIDPHCLRLAEFNAMLNGVEDRFVVFNNRHPDRFTEWLRDRHGQLDAAVSNPPFNPVPSFLAEYFTDFGNGGPLGLDVTLLFLRQAIPNLKPAAPFVAYAQLTVDSGGRYHLLPHIASDFGDAAPDVMVTELAGWDRGWTADEWARVLKFYLRQHSVQKGVPAHLLDEADTRIVRALRESGIHKLKPALLFVRRQQASAPEH